jgi:hypothetical protein
MLMLNLPAIATIIFISSLGLVVPAHDPLLAGELEGSDRPENSAEQTQSIEPEQLEATIEPEADRAKIANPSPIFTDIPPSTYERPRLIPLSVPESTGTLPGSTFRLNPQRSSDRPATLLTRPPKHQNYSITEPTRTRITDPTFSNISSPTGRFRR